MAQKKRDLKIYIPLTAVILLVLIAGIYWYIDYSKYIKTDDALVSSDVVSVSPKIMGRISKLYVEEGDSVKQGQLIAELDSTDLLAQKNQEKHKQKQTKLRLKQNINLTKRILKCFKSLLIVQKKILTEQKLNMQAV